MTEHVVVVQSLSCGGLFVTPWAAECQTSQSFTISWTEHWWQIKNVPSKILLTFLCLGNFFIRKCWIRWLNIYIYILYRKIWQNRVRDKMPRTKKEGTRQPKISWHASFKIFHRYLKWKSVKTLGKICGCLRVFAVIPLNICKNIFYSLYTIHRYCFSDKTTWKR